MKSSGWVEAISGRAEGAELRRIGNHGGSVNAVGYCDDLLRNTCRKWRAGAIITYGGVSDGVIIIETKYILRTKEIKGEDRTISWRRVLFV